MRLSRLCACAGAVALLSPAAACRDGRQERAEAARRHVANAEAALEKGDFARALAAAGLATEYDPLDPTLRDLVLRARLTALAVAPHTTSSDHPADLEYQAEWMAERDPARSHLWSTARGWLAMGRGDDVGAQVRFREAVRAKADFAPAQAGLGQVLLRAQKADEAAAAFDAALVADPRSPQALAGLGRLLLNRNEPARAAEVLAKALEVADAASVRMDLAAALAPTRPGEAGAQLQRAIALEPRNGEAHRRLGELLTQLGQPGAARAELTTASQLGAEPLATFGLAVLDRKEGQPAQAARRFEAVSNADPRLAAAGYLAGVSYEEAGDLGAAAKALQRYLEQAGGEPAEKDRVADARKRLAALEAVATAARQQPGRVSPPPR